jgi:hypothetical protein
MDRLLTTCRPPRRRRHRSPAPACAALVVLLVLGAGCHTAQTVSVPRLIRHQAMIDFSGLRDVATFEPVKAQAAAPRTWNPLAVKKTSLYTDMQWKSPSGNSGVGVTHVRMPLPLSAKMLIWFAKAEYTKKGDDGRLIDQWTDPLGRTWFEAANSRFHVHGYVITRGFEAWVIYTGYKTARPPDAAEMSLAARALETVVPLPGNPSRYAKPATADPTPPTPVN